MEKQESMSYSQGEKNCRHSSQGSLDIGLTSQAGTGISNTFLILFCIFTLLLGHWPKTTDLICLLALIHLVMLIVVICDAHVRSDGAHCGVFWCHQTYLSY